MPARSITIACRMLGRDTARWRACGDLHETDDDDPGRSFYFVPDRTRLRKFELSGDFVISGVGSA